ncbi:MAG: efflux RND transporter periplasmic adaptor subunit [Bacteroidetes bacterium]|nr:efflux RND transporter periplasmic adaptor subunit [Bacteroidota bacterium]
MKYIVYSVLILGLYACGGGKPAESEKNEAALGEAEVVLTDAQLKNADLTIGKAATRAMSTSLKVNGVVDVPPQNLVSVSFPLGGYLKSTELLPGMRIHKGQVIAVMEDPAFIQLQQDYLVARAKLEFQKKEYDRQAQLNASKTTSDKVFEQVQSDYQGQKITVNALSEKLKLIGLKPDVLNENSISRSVNIYSPIDGYVSAVNVNIGKYVNPADVLFELVNPEDLHLALTVFEKDIPWIQVGQKVQAHLANDPGHGYEAEVILIGRNLDLNRSTTVHCHFMKSEENLLPGMFLSAVIDVTNKSVVAVPEAAVVRYEDKEYVFLRKDAKHFEMVEVTTGTHFDGYVELLRAEALADRDVVLNNAYALLMKLKNTGE